MLAQQAVDGKSNEITAIPELLDMLALKRRDRDDRRHGNAEGDRPAHRRQRRGLCPCRSRATRPACARTRALFFSDPACAADCATTAQTDAGMAGSRNAAAGRRRQVAGRSATPDWKGLRSLAAVTARRIDKKDRRRKPRNPVLHLLPRARSQHPSRRRAKPLGNRDVPLDAGRDLRRRPLKNPKRRFSAELRRYPPYRLQYPQSRSIHGLPAPIDPAFRTILFAP